MTWETATGRPVIVCILQQEFDECAVWAQGCTSAMRLGFVKPTASESLRGPTQAATIHASIPPEKSPSLQPPSPSRLPVIPACSDYHNAITAITTISPRLPHRNLAERNAYDRTPFQLDQNSHQQRQHWHGPPPQQSYNKGATATRLQV